MTLKSVRSSQITENLRPKNKQLKTPQSLNYLADANAASRISSEGTASISQISWKREKQITKTRQRSWVTSMTTNWLKYSSQLDGPNPSQLNRPQSFLIACRMSGNPCNRQGSRRLAVPFARPCRPSRRESHSVLRPFRMRICEAFIFQSLQQ